ncbi:MAG TPA: DUF4157 domain-containing protein [Kofleriaceae bacterium]
MGSAREHRLSGGELRTVTPVDPEPSAARFVPGKWTEVERLHAQLEVTMRLPGLVDKHALVDKPAVPGRRTLAERAPSPDLGLDDHRVLGLRDLLHRLGPDHPLRDDTVRAAAEIARTIAGRALGWHGLPSGAASPDGVALWHAAERHAVTLHRKLADRGPVDAHDPATEAALELALQQRGGGQPLPPELREEMEHELGVSLSGVHVHTDGVAARATRAILADAFTVGEDIFFADGAFCPDTAAGRALIAHELAHVAQALRGSAGPARDGISVSSPGDATEREADAVAARILAVPRPAPARPTVDGPGQPMASEVRSKMERAFGVDFSSVRIFEGERAPALGARAYAQGAEIHFAPGEYRPDSARGQEILGHELAHVVQQHQGRVGATHEMNGIGVNGDAALEHEADELGARAARGESAHGARSAVLARPAPLPSLTTRTVQRLPYAEVHVGQWYRVQIGSKTVRLYLRSKQAGKDSKPPRFEFYRSEQDRRYPIIVVREDKIKKPVDAPARGPRRADHSKSDGALMRGPSSSDPGRLGIISWNVAHLSDHDFIAEIQQFIAQLQRFPKATLTTVFSTAPGVLQEIRAKPYVEECLKDGQAFHRNYEHDPTFERLLKGLQGKTGKVRELCMVIRDIEAVHTRFPAAEFLGRLDDMEAVGWLALYEQAQVDLSARTELVRQAAQLRRLADDVQSARHSLQQIRKLKNHKKLLELLGCSGRAGALCEQAKEASDALMSVSDLRRLPSALHAHNIVTHVGEMFDKNKDWLDVVTLHEVNDIAALDKRSEHVVHHGPQLISSGENGQREFYPLLVRKDANIAVLDVYIVLTDGTMQKTEHDQLYHWDKQRKRQADKVFRPIVVYEIQKGGKDGQIYWVAVVHTTPESNSGISEFNRNKIFAEIAAGLATLRHQADRRKIPLIIGGDYYLTAEAAVKELTSDDRDRLDDKDRKDGTSIAVKLRLLQEELESQLKLLESNPDPHAERLLHERLKFVAEATRDNQIFRNLCKLTVAAKVEDIGLLLAQPISGTNPKSDPLSRWFDLQIADFFIHNATLPDVNVGLVRPEGGLTTVDSEDLHGARYWQHFSDHLPVGGVFSMRERSSGKRPAAFRGDGSSRAARLARVSNRNRFARLRLQEMSRQRDLSLLKKHEIESLAIEYLRARIAEFYGEHPPPLATLDDCITVLDDGQRVLPDGEPVLITSPGDFEPDPDD